MSTSKSAFDLVSFRTPGLFENKERSRFTHLVNTFDISNFIPVLSMFFADLYTKKSFSLVSINVTRTNRVCISYYRIGWYRIDVESNPNDYSSHHYRYNGRETVELMNFKSPIIRIFSSLSLSRPPSFYDYVITMDVILFIYLLFGLFFVSFFFFCSASSSVLFFFFYIE